MSTPSSERGTSNSPPLYATELRWMFNDPTSVDQITDNVPDTTSAVIIRTLYHLSLTIDRLEEEVNQQRAEFSDVFDYAIENRQLRQHLRSSQ